MNNIKLTINDIELKIGQPIYVITSCGKIDNILDGNYFTATGYYCPYDLNNKCPHLSDECDDCYDIMTVFEDTIGTILLDEYGIIISATACSVMSQLNDLIFLTKEEAMQQLLTLNATTN